MERIKFGEYIYDLVPNGVPTSPEGGRVILLPGVSSFNDVESAVKTAKSFTVLNEDGLPILTRSDLVYAGYLAKDENYIIGSENTQTGTNENSGDQIFETHNVTGAVLIAEFRVPDVREQLASTQAKLEYVAMMANIDLEVE